MKDERNILYFRDLQDHVMRVTEGADSLRDSVYSLVEMHMNTVGIKMNEVMKVLTIITTIFTPIMFVASVYGMNFDWIPEIHVKGGYFIFWVIISLMTVVQIIFFRRKKWL
jgi:magnesium transporter